MNPELRARILINKNETIVDRTQASKHARETALLGSGNGTVPGGFDFQFDTNFADKLDAKFEAAKRLGLETVPRETVLLMFTEAKMDEHFNFSVSKGEGENYVQAMRQVLSRTRKKALKTRTALNEFKLLTIKIEEKEDHDEVTLVRTKHMNEHEESVYNILIEAIKKPVVGK